MEQDFEKMLISIRYWLLGKKYYKSLKAMEFAKKFHTGKRKDGSPEFSHQISQVAYIRTIIGTFDNPEDIICTIFLHDVCEDYNVSFEEIKALFGESVAKSVYLMTKVFRGTKKTPEEYFSDMLDDLTASISKGCDRIHNHYTMIGGFTAEKQKSYIEETEKYIIPMLKAARRKYPEQEEAFENIKFVLMNQMSIYKPFIKTILEKNSN